MRIEYFKSPSSEHLIMHTHICASHLNDNNIQRKATYRLENLINDISHTKNTLLTWINIRRNGVTLSPLVGEILVASLLMKNDQSKSFVNFDYFVLNSQHIARNSPKSGHFCRSTVQQKLRVLMKK